MPEPLRENDDILTSDRDAQYKRDLERARNLSYQKQQPQRPQSSRPSPTLDSGLQLNGKAANDDQGDQTQPSNGHGLQSLGGGATNDDQDANGVGNLGNNIAQGAVNAAVPGGSLANLWNNDLPGILRLMVIGKELTKPGGVILLWPILNLPYCFFGVGTLFFWMLQPHKSNGQEIKLADIKMGPIDSMILLVSLAVWGLIVLFFSAIFGAVTNSTSIIPGT